MIQVLSIVLRLWPHIITDSSPWLGGSLTPQHLTRSAWISVVLVNPLSPVVTDNPGQLSLVWRRYHYSYWDWRRPGQAKYLAVWVLIYEIVDSQHWRWGCQWGDWRQGWCLVMLSQMFEVMSAVSRAREEKLNGILWPGSDPPSSVPVVEAEGVLCCFHDWTKSSVSP